MVRGMYRSHRLRRVFVKTPGGDTKIQYKQRKPSKAKCAVYGTPLSGVPNVTDAKMRNLAKTKKRPQRPYGGVLSSKAMREVIKSKARAGRGESQ